ncbi:MAG TPA: HDOD domain-containing protein [Pirellulales bacterium]|jgi:DNA-binding response OmpR family regulator|nr:HDOD domain-containing protein [Pirellulales bacterium]
MSQSLKALVVDDDAAVRRLTARALCGEGFSCDLAGDGHEADTKLCSGTYDLVVTDLCMPNRHGHAFASELVETANRPLVVVLTALSDPRMTKDLLTRGVDDVVLKPVDYSAFAAKLRALVNRRTAAPQCAVGTASAPYGTVHVPDAADKASASAPLTLREFETHLAKVDQILPLSQNILKVSQLAQSPQCSSRELATAVEDEAALAVEVLRLANSCHFKPGGSRLVDLVEAIPRVGHRRIGELALSMHAAQLLNSGNLAWLNRDLARRRTIAAGLAADLLIAQGEHSAIQNGLFLSASMHGLGRVMLGLIFPQLYDALVAKCQERHETLQEHESRVFPMSHAAGMARLLQAWSVPPEIYQPLRYLLDDFDATAQFAEPLRSKVELVKIAVLLGWLAAGPWESWDLVDLGPHAVFQRLRIADPKGILDQIRDSLSSLAVGTNSSPLPDESPPEQKTDSTKRELRYRTLFSQPYDLFSELIIGMNMTIVGAPVLDRPADKMEIVNCMAASPVQIAAFRRSERSSNSILVGSARQLGQHRSKMQVIRMPISWAAVRSACEQATN